MCRWVITRIWKLIIKTTHIWHSSLAPAYTLSVPACDYQAGRECHCNIESVSGRNLHLTFFRLYFSLGVSCAVDIPVNTSKIDGKWMLHKRHNVRIATYQPCPTMFCFCLALGSQNTKLVPSTSSRICDRFDLNKEVCRSTAHGGYFYFKLLPFASFPTSNITFTDILERYRFVREFSNLNLGKRNCNVMFIE